MIFVNIKNEKLATKNTHRLRDTVLITIPKRTIVAQHVQTQQVEEVLSGEMKSREALLVMFVVRIKKEKRKQFHFIGFLECKYKFSYASREHERSTVRSISDTHSVHSVEANTA